MRKAFSANVSNARPKTRLGALLSTPPTPTEPTPEPEVAAQPPAPVTAAPATMVDPSTHDTIVPTRVEPADVTAPRSDAPHASVDEAIQPRSTANDVAPSGAAETLPPVAVEPVAAPEAREAPEVYFIAPPPLPRTNR